MRAAKKVKPPETRAQVAPSRAHGGDQRCSAGHQRDPAVDAFQDVRAEAPEQRHALLQGRLEIELAAHGALGDAGDPLAQADIARQLIQASPAR